MKNWEKMIALLLALAMVFALTACGAAPEKNEEDEEETISHRHEGRQETAERDLIPKTIMMQIRAIIMILVIFSTPF